MKLAWLCWYDFQDADEGPCIEFEEPEAWRFRKIVPIVYAEVIK